MYEFEIRIFKMDQSISGYSMYQGKIMRRNKNREVIAGSIYNGRSNSIGETRAFHIWAFIITIFCSDVPESPVVALHTKPSIIKIIAAVKQNISRRSCKTSRGKR